MADIQIINAGSLVGFVAVTDEAREWINDEVQAEGWQFLGKVLYLDCHTAPAIIDAALRDGLTVH